MEEIVGSGLSFDSTLFPIETDHRFSFAGKSQSNEAQFEKIEVERERRGEWGVVLLFGANRAEADTQPFLLNRLNATHSTPFAVLLSDEVSVKEKEKANDNHEEKGAEMGVLCVMSSVGMGVKHKECMCWETNKLSKFVEGLDGATCHCTHLLSLVARVASLLADVNPHLAHTVRFEFSLAAVAWKDWTQPESEPEVPSVKALQLHQSSLDASPPAGLRRTLLPSLFQSEDRIMFPVLHFHLYRLFRLRCEHSNVISPNCHVTTKEFGIR
ncbi:hypothetical protein BLNAU_6069 [Blattamonas nauphoetae]|uniref:SWIM-type domain-containing protein n=1 Tax=Blattamonas nauphoetae TaxID=2049346 RepID=A0ABQ9Y5M5_9EUKA|nr:hypothetical protein BLNAU_6069 [Blattamonas nauphoetae]